MLLSPWVLASLTAWVFSASWICFLALSRACWRSCVYLRRSSSVKLLFSWISRVLIAAWSCSSLIALGLTSGVTSMLAMVSSAKFFSAVTLSLLFAWLIKPIAFWTSDSIASVSVLRSSVVNSWFCRMLSFLASATWRTDWIASFLILATAVTAWIAWIPLVLAVSTSSLSSAARMSEMALASVWSSWLSAAWRSLSVKPCVWLIAWRWASACSFTAWIACGLTEACTWMARILLVPSFCLSSTSALRVPCLMACSAAARTWSTWPNKTSRSLAVRSRLFSISWRLVSASWRTAAKAVLRLTGTAGALILARAVSLACSTSTSP